MRWLIETESIISYMKIDESDRINVTEKFFISIHIERTLYYWIILIISIIAVVGNIMVVRSVSVRNYKYLQKTCMISLALSDILTVVTFCFNYLDLLGKRLNLIWTLGEFLCWYNPLGEVLGNLASSLALLVIALDRYHNVIYAFNKKWDPELWKCLAGVFVLWMICFGISYPMSTFYFHLPFRLPSGEPVYVCSGTNNTRGEIAFYYVLINTLFFLPLIVMFCWFYYKIAGLIWKHRKPVTHQNREEIDASEKSSYTKATSDVSNASRIQSIARKKKNVQMERKIRTFKIVIILIFAFILCRMPYWVLWLTKLLGKVRKGDGIWRTTFIFTSLNLLNCALNPFLYTYLNQTIFVCRKINDFICNTFCFCFSNAEFEDYERGATFYEGVLGKVATVEQPRNGRTNTPCEIFPQVPHFPKYTSVNRF